MNIENETEIIERAKAGDPAAVKKLVDMYADVIYRFSWNVCRDRDRAEHTTQETFVSVLRKLDQFDHKSKFSTWLYTIVSNHCLMLARRRKTERTVSMDDEEAPLPEGELGYASDDPHELAERADMRRHLDSAIAGLAPDYRTVFILRDIEGLSTEEVAGILNLSAPAVKSRLHRARSFLRSELAPLFKEDHNV